jgi:acyl-coenzyme A synthetase/AMP-(fatty) acid ligase
VEQLLERHPGVAEAVVVAAPDEIKGEIPVAFVVRKTGSAVTEQELRDHSLQQGAAFRHPRFVIFKDQIPVTGTHKVDRQALVAEASAVAAARRCR